MIFFTRTDEAKQNCINEIQKLNGTWKITITPVKRTLEQNAYFHSLLGEIAPYTPHTPEILKELLKAEFIGVRHAIWKGKKYAMPIPSSSLDKREYAVLLEKLLMLAEELGVQPRGSEYYGMQER